MHFLGHSGVSSRSVGAPDSFQECKKSGVRLTKSPLSSIEGVRSYIYRGGGPNRDPWTALKSSLHGVARSVSEANAATDPSGAGVNGRALRGVPRSMLEDRRSKCGVMSKLMWHRTEVNGRALRGVPRLMQGQSRSVSGSNSSAGDVQAGRAEPEEPPVSPHRR